MFFVFNNNFTGKKVAGFVLLASLPIFFGGSTSAAEQDNRRLWGFAGIDGEYSRMNTDLSNQFEPNTQIPLEFDKNGFQLNGKGLFSVYFDKFVFELGGGYLYNRGSGSGGIVTKEVITTRAGFGEFDARYLLDDHWQLGPILQVDFGTDVKFGAEKISPSVVTFAGLELAYEFPVNSWRMRFTVQGLTDLTIENRQVILAGAGIQLGFPLTSQEAAPTPMPTPQPTPVPLPPPTPAPKPVVKDELPPNAIRINVTDGLVFFDLNSAKLKDASRFKLMALGKFLIENKGGWSHLRVDGHTDSRGTPAYNMKLSQRRAEAVKTALVAAGVDRQLIEARGYGLTHPRVSGENEEAWAQNRRVEFIFFDVEHPEKMRKKIEVLQGG